MKCIFCDKWHDKPMKCKCCRRWFCPEHINGHNNICFDASARIKAQCEEEHDEKKEETLERIMNINTTLENIKISVENDYLKSRIEALEEKLAYVPPDKPVDIVKDEIAELAMLTNHQKTAIKSKISHNNKRIEKIEKKVEQSEACDRLSKRKPRAAAKPIVKPKAAPKKARCRPRKKKEP